MNELEFTEKILNMSEKQLECVEDRIYNDCVYYNDCDLCPHKFEIYEICHCKLNAITMLKRINEIGRNLEIDIEVQEDE